MSVTTNLADLAVPNVGMADKFLISAFIIGVGGSYLVAKFINKRFSWVVGGIGVAVAYTILKDDKDDTGKL